MTIQELRYELRKQKARSAWRQGVLNYAWDLVDNIENSLDTFEYELPNTTVLEKMMLNGADNWKQYSWGGCSLIYDCDIAAQLCAPWELRKSENGKKQPNKREEWLDVQARALYQASALIKSLCK